MRLFCCVRMGTSFLKCKGMREYVLIPSYLPIAREVMAFLACGALWSVSFVFDCSSAFSPGWVISGTVSFVFIVDCAFKFCFVQTPALEGIDVGVLRFPTTAVWSSWILAVGCKTVDFDIAVAVDCSFLGVRSICAGLTRSADLAFDWHFKYSTAPSDDLIRSVVRGSQRWCNCDSSQNYMWTCVELLILERIFLSCVAWGA